MPIAIIPMAQVYKWSLHAQGWILSAFAFGYFTSQLLGVLPFRKHLLFHITLQNIIAGSCWASRLGAKNVLICSVLLWSIATFVTPLLAHSLVALVIGRIILGFAEGLGILSTIFTN